MKTISFFLLFILFTIPGIYADQSPKSTLSIEQGASAILEKLKETTVLTSSGEEQMKTLLLSYLKSRERLFSEAASESREVDFARLKELYDSYKQSEMTILKEMTPGIIDKKSVNGLPQEEVSSLSSAVTPMNIVYCGDIQYATYRDVTSPTTIVHPYYDSIDGAIVYYVDFGAGNYVSVDWTVDLTTLNVDIYAMHDRTICSEHLRTLSGVDSDSLCSRNSNGRLLIYIYQAPLDGNISHLPLKFTIRKIPVITGDFSVEGVSLFQDNVGIKTDTPRGSLDVNGTTFTSELVVGGDDNEGNLRIDMQPTDPFVSFTTDRPSFYFNKPLSLKEGVLSTFGTSSLQLRTHGTTRMTILNSNGNVGIGTTTPSEKLEVNGNVKAGRINLQTGNQVFSMYVPNTSYAYFSTNSGCFLFNKSILSLNGEFGRYGAGNIRFMTNGSPKMTIADSSGNIGIGTETPEYKLDVKGNTATDHLTALNGIQIGKSASAPIGSDSKRLYFGNSNENTDAVYIARYNEGNDISELRVSVGDDTSDRFVVGNRPWDSSAFNPVLTVKMNGNVGIGEADPAYTLDVKGKIRAEEVVITTAWADFVFADNYNLPSLKEVHQHIREKKHLPGIPSESEVKENGVGIADIQVKLLQKIEELTLYMIQQQQLIEQLQEKINTMNQ